MSCANKCHRYWAPIYNAGMLYNLNERWGINTSLSFIPSKTTGTFTGPGVGYGPATTSGSSKMKSIDYVARINYLF